MGTGQSRCARRLEAEESDWFASPFTEEGVELREAGITKPYLCLGSFWPGQEETIISNGLTPVIFELDDRRGALGAVAAARMMFTSNRLPAWAASAFDWPDAAEFAAGLEAYSNLNVTGIMTHLASADDRNRTALRKKQIERFREACQSLGRPALIRRSATLPTRRIHQVPNHGSISSVSAEPFTDCSTISFPGKREARLKPVYRLSRVSRI